MEAALWSCQMDPPVSGNHSTFAVFIMFFSLVYIWMRSVSAGGRLCKAKLGKQSRGPQQAQTTKKHWHTRFYSEFLSAPGWALSFTMSQGSNTFSLFNQAIFIKHFTSSSAHSRLVSHSCLWRRRLRLGNIITLVCVCARARARVEAYWHLDLDKTSSQQHIDTTFRHLHIFSWFCLRTLVLWGAQAGLSDPLSPSNQTVIHLEQQQVEVLIIHLFICPGKMVVTMLEVYWVKWAILTARATLSSEHLPPPS